MMNKLEEKPIAFKNLTRQSIIINGIFDLLMLLILFLYFHIAQILLFLAGYLIKQAVFCFFIDNDSSKKILLPIDLLVTMPFVVGFYFFTDYPIYVSLFVLLGLEIISFNKYRHLPFVHDGMFYPSEATRYQKQIMKKSLIILVLSMLFLFVIASILKSLI
ncbi:MAG: hypothetical protein AB7U79_05335 [Candidatus Izemoplasmatales bacterium]